MCVAAAEMVIDLKNYTEAKAIRAHTGLELEKALIHASAQTDIITSKANALHLAKYHCTCGECVDFYKRHFE